MGMKDYVSFMTKEQVERFEKFMKENNITEPLNEFVGSRIQFIEQVGVDNVRKWLCK